MRQILFFQGLCEELDDAVQDVFLRVFRAPALPDEAAFLGWFYYVILNTGRDLGRRRKTRASALARLTQVAPVAHADPDQGAHLPNPALAAALQELTPEFREAVALRFFADLSLEEIARTQQVPLGTVKSRLHTAMARLRISLVKAGAQP